MKHFCVLIVSLGFLGCMGSDDASQSRPAAPAASNQKPAHQEEVKGEQSTPVYKQVWNWFVHTTPGNVTGGVLGLLGVTGTGLLIHGQVKKNKAAQAAEQLRIQAENAAKAQMFTHGKELSDGNIRARLEKTDGYVPRIDLLDQDLYADLQTLCDGNQALDEVYLNMLAEKDWEENKQAAFAGLIKSYSEQANASDLNPLIAAWLKALPISEKYNQVRTNQIKLILDVFPLLVLHTEDAKLTCTLNAPLPN